MKKYKTKLIFISIGLISVFCLVLNSCLKDKPIELKRLEVRTQTFSVFEGEALLFESFVDNKPINADIYIDGAKITSNTYIFKTVGKFKVVAKLSGYLDSQEIEITVSERPKLVLSASQTAVLKDESVTFNVTSDNQSINADIYIDGTKITGNTYTFKTVGKFGVVAKLQGYLDSDEISIIVREPQYKIDVYVAGFEVAGASQIAKYWKNGSPISLTSSSGIAFATSIFVYNEDVYVAGFEENSRGVTVAKYWKNGYEVTLTNGASDAEANSIFVYNGDVYVAGFERDGLNTIAKYWKNGVGNALGGSSETSNAFSIFISNGDIFVAGTKTVGDRVYANYWRNGLSSNLSDGSQEATAYSIFVNNNDVYLAGRDSNGSIDIAKYWKNSASSTLSMSGVEATAYSVFYYNGDAYVAGFESDKAILWKNGTRNVLSGGTNGNSVFVLDGDVYVAGYEYNNEVFIAKYWKNGTPINLTDGNNFATANAIFVTKELIE